MFEKKHFFPFFFFSPQFFSVLLVFDDRSNRNEKNKNPFSSFTLSLSRSATPRAAQESHRVSPREGKSKTAKQPALSDRHRSIE